VSLEPLSSMKATPNDFQIQRKTEAGTIDPALADLTQPPYSPGIGQGVCDFRQVCGLVNDGETVSFFCEGNPLFLCLAGDVFMAIQHDLCSERGMAGQLKSDMSPVGIHDVEGIVIDESSLGFQVLDDPLFGPPNFPDGCRRSSD